ncbi:hypothetical protein GCM10020216_055240 [Nonomuraea helvata]
MDEERLKCLDLTDGRLSGNPDEYDATLGTLLHFVIDTDLTVPGAFCSTRLRYGSVDRAERSSWATK